MRATRSDGIRCRLGGILLLLGLVFAGRPGRSQEAAGRFSPEAHLPMESLFHLHIAGGAKLLQAVGGTLPGSVIRDAEIRAALGNLPDMALSHIRQSLFLLPGLGSDDLERLLGLFSGEVVLSVTGLDPYSFVSVVLAVELGAERAAAIEMIERLEKGLAGEGTEPRTLEIGKRKARFLQLPPRGIYYLELGQHLVFSLSPEVLKGICAAFDRTTGGAPKEDGPRDFRLKDNEAFAAVGKSCEVQDPCLRLTVNIEGLRSLAMMGLANAPQGKAISQILTTTGLMGVSWLGYSLGARDGDVEGKLAVRTSGKPRGILGAFCNNITPPAALEDALRWLPASTRSFSGFGIEPGKILKELSAAYKSLAPLLPAEVQSLFQKHLQEFETNSGLTLAALCSRLSRINVFLASVPPPGGSLLDDTLVFVKTAELAPYLDLARQLIAASRKQPAPAAAAPKTAPVSKPGEEASIVHVRAAGVLSRLLGLRFEEIDIQVRTLAQVVDPAISIAAAPLDAEWSVVSQAPQPIVRYLRFHARGPKLDAASDLRRYVGDLKGAGVFDVFKPGHLFLTAFNSAVSLLNIYGPMLEAQIQGLGIDFYMLPPAEKFLGGLKAGFLSLQLSENGIVLHGHRVISAYSGAAVLGAAAIGASAFIGSQARGSFPFIFSESGEDGTAPIPLDPDEKDDEKGENNGDNGDEKDK